MADYHWHVITDGELDVMETDAVRLDRESDDILARRLDGAMYEALGSAADRATAQWVKHVDSEFRILMLANRVLLLQEVRGCFRHSCRQEYRQYWIAADEWGDLPE